MEHLDPVGSPVLQIPQGGGSPLTTSDQKEKQTANFSRIFCPPDLMFFTPVTWADLKQAEKSPV